jgi:hypothetical protein
VTLIHRSCLSAAPSRPWRFLGLPRGRGRFSRVVGQKALRGCFELAVFGLYKDDMVDATSTAPGGAEGSEGSDGEGEGEEGGDDAPLRPLADVGDAAEGLYEGDRMSGGGGEVFASTNTPAATLAVHTSAAHTAAALPAVASS